jgi:hypothetical protein
MGSCPRGKGAGLLLWGVRGRPCLFHVKARGGGAGTTPLLDLPNLGILLVLFLIEPPPRLFETLPPAAAEHESGRAAFAGPGGEGKGGGLARGGNDISSTGGLEDMSSDAVDAGAGPSRDGEALGHGIGVDGDILGVGGWGVSRDMGRGGG